MKSLIETQNIHYSRDDIQMKISHSVSSWWLTPNQKAVLFAL